MKTNKQIFLDVLPRKIYKGTNCIDWINSVGCKGERGSHGGFTFKFAK